MRRPLTQAYEHLDERQGQRIVAVPRRGDPCVNDGFAAWPTIASTACAARQRPGMPEYAQVAVMPRGLFELTDGRFCIVVLGVELGHLTLREAATLGRKPSPVGVVQFGVN